MFPAKAGCDPKSTEIVPTIKLYGPEIVAPSNVMIIACQSSLDPNSAYTKSNGNEIKSIIIIIGLRKRKRSLKNKNKLFCKKLKN